MRSDDRPGHGERPSDPSPLGSITAAKEAVVGVLIQRAGLGRRAIRRVEAYGFFRPITLDMTCDSTIPRRLVTRVGHVSWSFAEAVAPWLPRLRVRERHTMADTVIRASSDGGEAHYDVRWTESGSGKAGVGRIQEEPLRGEGPRRHEQGCS